MKITKKSKFPSKEACFFVQNSVSYLWRKKKRKGRENGTGRKEDGKNETRDKKDF